jgi:glycosyltransferase involved in cell wall biosynthesis
MKRPRIALVTALWPLPGAPHAGKPIYETALRLLDHADVEVFCPAPKYPEIRWLRPRRYVYARAEARFAPPGLRTQYLEFGTVPWLGRAFNGYWTKSALGPALQAWKPDLLLSYWLYPTAWAAVQIAQRLRVPVVVGSRGSDLHRIPDALARRFTATALRSADAVVTVTEDLRRLALGLGASADRTHTIPNGCDTTVYHPIDRNEARLRLSIPLDCQLAVQVGHLIASKGVLDLWNAFALLAPRMPRLRLALIGEGPAFTELRGRANAAGLTDRLMMPGARPPSEIPLWLSASDVACLASHGEGCPNVVIEALACGRPVVGTRVGGIPDLVQDTCGVLVPAREPAALAGALESALRRTWPAEEIARRFTRTWNEVACETYAVCETALSTGRRRS